MIDLEKFGQDLKEGCKLALFGSRETPDRVLQLMEDLGKKFARFGARAASGHCQGADLAWERSFCSVRPENFYVCLPWWGYNKEIPVHPRSKVAVLAKLPEDQKQHYLATAMDYHPAWSRLTQGGQLLQGRNILIGENAKYGFTCLSDRPGGGGSGQCKRYLEAWDVPVIDLRLRSNFDFWSEWVS